jgi:hypothetical protein
MRACHTVLTDILRTRHLVGGADELWKALEELGLTRTSLLPDHDTVGNLVEKRLLAERYLSKVRILAANGEGCYHYRWGQRTRAEICEKDIVCFIAEVHARRIGCRLPVRGSGGNRGPHACRCTGRTASGAGRGWVAIIRLM